MTEEHSELQAALEKRLKEAPENTLDPERKEKLLEIRQLSAEELGDLMVEAAATRFHKPSLLTRLEDCANILIAKLDLADSKDIQLSTTGGMATMWRMRVGAYPSSIFNLLARFHEDSYPTVAGELRYANLKEAAKAQQVPYEEAQAVPWFVEVRAPSADPETYVRECLVAMGTIEPEQEPEEEPTY